MPKRPSSKRTSKQSSADKTRAHHVVVRLPGYWRFTKEVMLLLAEHRRLFLRLWLLVAVTLFVVVGLSETAQYGTLSGATDEAVASVPEASTRFGLATGILLSSVLGSSISSALTETQQIFRTAVYVLLWLVVIWMLRHILAGTAIRLRDALYNAAAPLLPSLAIAAIGVLQLLPVALLTAFFAALLGTGALSTEIVGIIMVVSVVLLSVMTLHWLSTTLMALMIVTIPGTYPLAAYRSARALVVGKRRQLLLRLLWLVGIIIAAYIGLILPWIVLDAGTGLSVALPLVVVSNGLAAASAIYASSYLYLLYRRLIDERTD